MHRFTIDRVTAIRTSRQGPIRLYIVVVIHSVINSQTCAVLYTTQTEHKSRERDELTNIIIIR